MNSPYPARLALRPIGRLTSPPSGCRADRAWRCRFWPAVLAVLLMCSPLPVARAQAGEASPIWRTTFYDGFHANVVCDPSHAADYLGYAGGLCFVSATTWLAAIDDSSTRGGNLEWRWQTPGTPAAVSGVSAPAHLGGMAPDSLFLAAGDGRLYRLGLAEHFALGTVDPRRSACSSDQIAGAPVVQEWGRSNTAFQRAHRDSDSLVFVQTRDGCGDATDNRVIAYSANTLQVKWQFNADGAYTFDRGAGCTLDYGTNTLLCATDDQPGGHHGNTMIALDTLTGEIKWSANVGRVSTPPVLGYGGQRVYVESGTPNANGEGDDLRVSAFDTVGDGAGGASLIWTSEVMPNAGRADGEPQGPGLGLSAGETVDGRHWVAVAAPDRRLYLEADFGSSEARHGIVDRVGFTVDGSSGLAFKPVFPSGTNLIDFGLGARVNECSVDSLNPPADDPGAGCFGEGGVSQVVGSFLGHGFIEQLVPDPSVLGGPVDRVLALEVGEGPVLADYAVPLGSVSLAVDETVDAGTVPAGHRIGFAATIRSEGGGGVTSISRAAKNVMAVAALPSGPSLNWSVDPPVAGCSVRGQTLGRPQLSCALGYLAPGSSAAVHLSATTTTPLATIARACGTYRIAALDVSADNHAPVKGTDLNVTVACGAVARLVLSPGFRIAPSGGQVAYHAEGFDAQGNDLGDVTSGTAFTITPDGSCTANACASGGPGNHTITGRYHDISARAVLFTPGRINPRHLVLTPAHATVSGVQRVTYRAELFDSSGRDLGEATAATTFTISPDGACAANVCHASQAGDHTVTGTDGTATGTATLTANRPLA